MNKSIAFCDNGKNFEIHTIDYISDDEERKMEEYKKSISEMNGLLKDIVEMSNINILLNKMIVEQHDEITNISENIIKTLDVVDDGAKQLEIAKDYQKSNYVRKGILVTGSLIAITCPIIILAGLKIGLIIGTVGLVGGGAIMTKK